MSENPRVQLVVAPSSGLLATFIEDTANARRAAEAIEGVVVDLPVKEDYRDDAQRAAPAS